MRYLPIGLMYLRLILGILLLPLSIFHIQYYMPVAICIIAMGLLSDILDGIIARRLGISSSRLRRLDSSIDQVFWCMVAISTFVQWPPFFYRHAIELIILVSAEAATYITSYIKFRKEVATHALSSKVWTLLLFATLVEIIVTGNSGLLFQLCFYIGVITRFEIIAILLLLRSWINDVPSVFHAVKLRQGRIIKRSKWFNG